MYFIHFKYKLIILGMLQYVSHSFFFFFYMKGYKGINVNSSIDIFTYLTKKDNS